MRDVLVMAASGVLRYQWAFLSAIGLALPCVAKFNK